jgi:hypothetical protein
MTLEFRGEAEGSSYQACNGWHGDSPETLEMKPEWQGMYQSTVSNYMHIHRQNFIQIEFFNILYLRPANVEKLIVIGKAKTAYLF